MFLVIFWGVFFPPLFPGYKVALAAEMQSHDDFDATTIFSKDDGNEAAHQDGKNQVPSKL